jgi:hypothetical protein
MYKADRAEMQPNDLAVLTEPRYRLLPDGAYIRIRSGTSYQPEQWICQLPRSGRVGIQEALWHISDAVYVVSPSKIIKAHRMEKIDSSLPPTSHAVLIVWRRTADQAEGLDAGS